jgi:hypothetical protein
MCWMLIEQLVAALTGSALYAVVEGLCSFTSSADSESGIVCQSLQLQGMEAPR